MAVTAVKAVTTPNLSDVHVIRPVSDMSIMYKQDDSMFVAHRFFPSRRVRQSANSYYIYDKDFFRRILVSQRSPGTKAEAIEFNVSTDTYNCIQWHAAAEVLDEERVDADEALDPDRDAAELLGQQFAMHEEQLFADTYLNSSAWNNQTLTTTWEDDMSTPIADVNKAKLNILRRTGKMPNKMILGAETASILMTNEDIRGTVEGGATTSDPAIIDESFLSRAFGLRVMVMKASKTNAIEGATAVDTDEVFINKEKCLICYAPDGVVGLRTVSAAVKFEWDMFSTGRPINVRRFRSQYEEEMLTKYVGIHAFHHKIVGKPLGVYIENTIS